MIKEEYLRLLKSKWTFFWCSALSLIYLIFCRFQMIEIQNLQNLLLEEKTEDLELVRVKNLLDGTNGFTYLFNFYFSSDFYIVFSIICLLCMGILFGEDDYCRREGMGNFIFPRVNYLKYTIKIIAARTLYIITVIATFEITTCLITLMIYPVKKCTAYNFSLNLTTNSITHCFILLLLHLIVLLSYLVLVMIFSYIINVKCTNKYVMMMIPFFVYIIPFIACSVTGSFLPTVSHMIELCVSERYILIIADTYQREKFHLEYLSFPVLLLTLSCILIKSMSGERKNFLNSRC